TWFCSIILQQSSIELFDLIVIAGEDIQSAAVKSMGLASSATARHAMSRSVMIPIGLLFCAASTTGMAPKSSSTIMRATWGRPMSGVQQNGSLVMISCTCMDHLRFRNLVTGHLVEINGFA